MNVPPTPISNATLTANPHFAALHEYLVKHKINANTNTNSNSTNTLQHQVQNVSNAGLGGHSAGPTPASLVEDTSKAESAEDAQPQLQAARVRRALWELLVRFLRAVNVAETGHGGEGKSGLGSKPSELPRLLSQGQNWTSAAQAHLSTATPLTLGLAGDAKESLAVLSTYLHLALFQLYHFNGNGNGNGSAISFPHDTEALLSDDLATFRAHLPSICDLVSTQITDTRRVLSRFAADALPVPLRPTPSPAPTKTNLHENDAPPPLLETLQQAQHTYTSTIHGVIPALLTDANVALEAVLSEHAAGLVDQIRTLERRTYGTQSRHTLAKAGLLGAVAEGIECKARITHLQTVKGVLGDEEGVVRLRGVLGELEAEERVLERREQQLGALLGEYEAEVKAEGQGNGKGDRGQWERVWGALGQKYKDVEGEIDVVRRDVGMLEAKIQGSGRGGR